MPVPTPIAQMIEKRASLTVLALIVATAITSPFDLGWRQLEILTYVGLVVLLAEFWIDSARQRGQIDLVRTERDTAIARAEQADAVAQRVPQLEIEVTGLEEERDALKEKVRAPQLSLEEILAALDNQLGFAALVTKHREWDREGLGSQWPVTSIVLREGEAVVVQAHIDEHAERFAAEWISLVDVGGTPLVAAQITGASDHQLTAILNLTYFPEHLQEWLVEQGSIPAAGYTLRLIGLTFPAYVSMSDSQLQQFGDALREASRAIAQSLNPQNQLSLVEGGQPPND
jgi:hypothetical protein